MNTYIGIDVGTSSAKLLLVGADGSLLDTASVSYPVYYPESGWSEQDPAEWKKGVFEGIKKLTGNNPSADIRGIGVAGQMHGLVMLDEKGKPIRPAIIWNDGRTEKQTEYLNNVIGRKKLDECTANTAFAGFTAPKILWVRENEPDNYSEIRKILLPKDYIVYVLTGKYSSDVSDASGTLLFDVKNRRWSDEMCRICSVKTEWLPEVYESSELVGTVKEDVAEQLGLPAGVRVIAGAGDNAAAAVGTGTVTDGACNISVGTSGTVFISSDKFAPSKNNALHSFCHANGAFHQMGCMLSAASCSKWWVEDILRSGYSEEEKGAEDFLGRNEVFFLPYLMGERSPHNDVRARGAFIGMRADTGREKLTLAVMEGVSFGLKDSIERACEVIKITRTGLCGGGSRSSLWRKIIANVLNMPIDIPEIEEGPSYGAAVLAMTGCGEYASLERAVKQCVKIKETVYPDNALAGAYAERYRIFRTLYPALRESFKEM